MITTGQERDSNFYGMVSACVLDKQGQIAASTSSNENGKWHHAEYNAIEKYKIGRAHV